MEGGYVRIISQYLKDDVRRVDEILRPSGGRLTCSADMSHFQLSGTRDAVEAAARELDDIAARVIAADYQLTRTQSYFEDHLDQDTLRGIVLKHR